MARIRIRPYRVLAVIHGWVGFPLAVLFLVVCGSGLYLAVDDLVERYDRHGQTYRPLTLTEQVAGLEAMMQRYPAASTYSVPTPARPFFRSRPCWRVDERYQDLKIVELGCFYKGVELYPVVLALYRLYLAP